MRANRSVGIALRASAKQPARSLRCIPAIAIVTAPKPTMQIDSLYRYPVKGLSPERLDIVPVAAGEGFPLDRAFALLRTDAGFDPAVPAWLPKANFVMLHEPLAALKTRYTPADNRLRMPSQWPGMMRASIAGDRRWMLVMLGMAPLRSSPLARGRRLLRACRRQAINALRNAPRGMA